MADIYVEENTDITITAFRGAVCYKDVIWRQNEAPVDLSSATAEMKVRTITYPTVSSPSTTMGAVIFTITNSNYILLGGTTGRIEIVIPTATVNTASSGKYYYDLEVTISGEKFKPLHGDFIVKAGINT